MGARTVTFAKAGRYVLGAKPVVSGMPMMDVETVGPDNVLRLYVSVS